MVSFFRNATGNYNMMKQINTNGKYLYEYVGNRYYGSEFIQVFDRGMYEKEETELIRLREKYKKICKNTVKDGDEIYLSENISFPRQIVSVNKIPIKFSKKSQKIVYKVNPYTILYELYKMQEAYAVYINPSRIFQFPSIIIIKKNMLIDQTLDNIKNIALKRFPGSIIDSIQEIYYTPSERLDNLPEDCIPFCNFVNYINSKLPILSEAESDSIMNLIKSDIYNNNKLGFDLLKAYNNSPLLLPMLHHIANRTFDSKISNSVAYKYFISIYNLPKRYLKRIKWGGISKMELMTLLCVSGLTNKKETIDYIGNVEDCRFKDMIDVCLNALK